MKGCITAIITPFNVDGALDYEGFRHLLEFQMKGGVSGIVVAGTTGEGPTVEVEEWRRVVSGALDTVGKEGKVIANTGTNSTHKTLEMTREAADIGCTSVLVVDPYYNGPSSAEIRREHYAPIAEACPSTTVIPYVIPGRTGTQILPYDLSILYSTHPNVSAVKDATGDDSFARELRSRCGASYSILSGDDDRTLGMMLDDAIRADGVVSVISNIAPRAVSDMVSAAANGEVDRAKTISNALKPLFQIVTVKTEEAIPGGTIHLKFRNPVPVKTLARLLGIPSGPCRRPLGRMTKKGAVSVLNAARTVWDRNPEILRPIESSFDISIDERLSEKYLEGMFYE